MNTDVTLAPELMIVSNPDKAGEYSYRLDSGKEDLNRTLTSNDLTTLNFLDIPVVGFDKYLYFTSQSELDTFISQLKRLPADPIDITPYEVKKTGPDVITAVTGSVAVTFANKAAGEPDSVLLCHPVYRIYPDKKGELFPVEDVRQYVSETWIEKCKQALFNTDNAGYKSPRAQSSFFVSPAFIGLLIITFLAMMITLIAAVAFSSSPANANQKATSLQTPAAMTDSLLTNNSTHPAAAAYGGGFEGQAGHGSVEDFSRLQVEQTEAMLKSMGVDIKAAQNQNLGCFTKEAS